MILRFEIHVVARRDNTIDAQWPIQAGGLSGRDPNRKHLQSFAGAEGASRGDMAVRETPAGIATASQQPI
jgi:hypothetical protein